MVDYSFLRLEKSLEKALNIGNPNISDINYNNQVHLIPNEFYCQITNTNFGITLAGDYIVKLVDKCDNEIDDITEYFAISEFSDIRGLNQIAFEFKIKSDYGLNPILFKIIHTESESVYYSNPFVCTETLKEQTSLFTYKNYGYFNGISYDMFEGYQQIRLNLWFDNVENQTETSEYYQISTKNTISSRAMYKQVERYQSTYMNRFTFERSNIMFIHDVVYVDSIRITNKPQLSSEERLGNSNLFPASIDMFKDYNDTFVYEPQIFDLNVVSKFPFGVYTFVSPSQAMIIFDVNIINLGGTLIEMRDYYTDEVYKTFNDDFLNFDFNSIFFSIGLAYPFSKYYFTISPNTISSTAGIVFEGIQDKDSWWFVRKKGDYSELDYDSGDYSITI